MRSNVFSNHTIPSEFKISECNQKRSDTGNMTLNYSSYLIIKMKIHQQEFF